MNNFCFVNTEDLGVKRLFKNIVDHIYECGYLVTNFCLFMAVAV